MKNLLPLCCVVVLMSLFDSAINLRAQGTAFTYQGRLNHSGSPANGVYDLRFTIYDSTNTPGVVIAGPITNTTTSVSNGLFTTTLDFGAGVFDGNARWLEIGVKSNGVAGAHIPLTPRQALTPSPYAIFASGAQTASTVAMGGVSTTSLAVGAVNSSAVADGAIQTNDLSAPLLDGTFWRLNGNSGPGNFLGSTDNRPLELRVNNTPALRLVPTSSGANIVVGFSSNSVRNGIEGATISGGGAPDEPNRIEGGFSTISGGWGNTNNGFNGFIGGGYWNRIEAGGLSFNNFIGGGAENAIGSNVLFGVVAGGRGNVISNQSQYPTIGGGRFNRAAGSFSTVGGGLRNTAEGGFSTSIAGGTVSGGSDNLASGNATFIGAGSQNTNTSLGAVIAGGERNTIFGVSDYATISGGRQNTIQTNSDYSVIGGGHQNVIHDIAGASTIAGGRQNAIQTNATYAVIAGGYNNVIYNNADASTIGGGEGNFISNAAPHAVIAGGIGNRSDAGASFIGGGSYNVNNGPGAFIGGGIANRAENFDAVVGGGGFNVNAGYRSSIGGGEGNSIFALGSHSTIGGGAYNAIHTNAFSSTVGGGVQNIISRDAFNSTIGGGYTNIIETNAVASTIAGGTFNVIGPSAFVGTIGGGTANNNSGPYATIGGGYGNIARGTSSTVGGGRLNNATGQYATVPGGEFSDALGDYSLASGRRAKASHPGTYVWADSTDADFTSTSNNQFSVRASGGVRLVTGGVGMTLDGQPVLSGVVSDSQLSANIARLNAPAVFTGPVSFSNAVGTFSGNGAGMTNVNLSSLNSGGSISWPGNFVLASSPVMAGGASSVTAADVNGDGRLDLICANISGDTVSILTNSGSGSFVLASSPTVGDEPYMVRTADVNGDGKLDLITPNYSVDTLSVLTNNGSGSFALAVSPVVGNEPAWVVAADFNGDGRTDLASVNHGANNFSVLTNNGSGGFMLASSPGAGAFPFSGATADVNADGKPDLLSANYGANTLSVLTNNGSGGFAFAGVFNVGSFPQSMTTSDVNGDGRMDAITANYGDSTLSVLTNNGSGGFALASSPAVGSGPYSVAAGDVNGDGKADLISANINASTLSVLTNNGSSGFVLASSPGGGAFPVSVAAADVSGDGKADLISVGYSSSTISVLFNTPAFNGGFTGNGAGLTSLNAASLTGSVPPASLTSVPAANLTGSVPSASLTSVPAGSLTGTIADARLSANVAQLNANQTFTGNNSFSSALGLGTANPAAKLHLYSTDNPTTFRIQSTGTPGLGRIEFVSNPQGDPFEWRPGYIQSLDAGGFTGGLGFYLNGSGFGNAFGNVEVMRLVNGRVGIGTNNPQSALHVVGTVTATAFNPPSDRNLKENFESVSPREVLEKVSALPISRWNFKGDAATPHVGPMAQDFHAAFGLGTDDKHIATVDADGVALAAIQGLNEKLEAEVKSKDARISELERRLAAIETLLQK